uniref:Carbohydrate kinase FGGY N-terminal domain-containing protein n=1 Tax=Chromera velia CCMP2878 TaxID=1169474 RepID=A0A0G4G8J7_9ALVE|eukprot:Cvel_20749.t1-p1 / transcript=Cvel_20749.t1 / gene=Cvel_20749 / organism=Chromera_velia_CCMP2878 / gene_product=hypothetical protein / transcript_product=hypothetical protein / location=Cvel_scaffold1890:23349-26720(-) / protein_length=745 / sequence_SO=supercontig / SO=protein_coding / is_pseudo=false
MGLLLRFRCGLVLCVCIGSFTRCSAFGTKPPRIVSSRPARTRREAGTELQTEGDGDLFSCGLDFGTSGARVSVARRRKETETGTSGARVSVARRRKETETGEVQFDEVFSERLPWSSGGSSDPFEWEGVMWELLGSVPAPVRSRVSACCVSGTSASVLLVDRNTGLPVDGERGRPRMYNWQAEGEELVCVDKFREEAVRVGASPMSSALSSSSALSKLLCWDFQKPLEENEWMAHQSDYMAMRLATGMPGGAPSRLVHSFSDWHNVLKDGYDLEELRYPEWIQRVGERVGEAEGGWKGRGARLQSSLPARVVPPGRFLFRLSPSGRAVTSLGLGGAGGGGGEAILPAVGGGTTDSNAAFLSTGASTEGDAVVSLGSTIAIKVLSRVRLEDSALGVYSHRFPNLGGSWAASPASVSILGRAPEGEKSFPEGEEQEEGGSKRGALWLAGGASNCGARLFRELGLSDETLAQTTKKILQDSEANRDLHPEHAETEADRERDALEVSANPSVTTSPSPSDSLNRSETAASCSPKKIGKVLSLESLFCYPLSLSEVPYPLPPSVKGERFPFADTNKMSGFIEASLLDGHGLPGIAQGEREKALLMEALAALTAVEAEGFRTLKRLGLSPLPLCIRTSGGGGKNEVWRRLRQSAIAHAMDLGVVEMSSKKREEEASSKDRLRKPATHGELTVEGDCGAEPAFGAARLGFEALKLENRALFESDGKDIIVQMDKPKWDTAFLGQRAVDSSVD